MKTFTYIYALLHPTTNEVRYIGKTINIKQRFANHYKDKTKSKKKSWLISLLPLKPEMIILEEAKDDDWIEAEQFWIAYFKSLGARLTNLSKGGEGASGYKFTPEQKLKQKLALLNRTPEEILATRKKLSISHLGNQNGKGYKHTDEALVKISEASKARKKIKPEKLKFEGRRTRGSPSEETRRKISESNKGKRMNVTEEHRMKLSIAAKADWAKRKQNKLMGEI